MIYRLSVLMVMRWGRRVPKCVKRDAGKEFQDDTLFKETVRTAVIGGFYIKNKLI